MFDQQLSAELSAALVRELQRCYDWENRVRFGRRLVRPVLVLVEHRRRLGRWVSATRTLELSQALVLERVELRGVGLVWAGDKRLEEFSRRRHPRVVRRRRTVRFNNAHLAGREAGHTVVLHKPVSTGSSGRTRLLE
jgi:hypothetical protein